MGDTRTSDEMALLDALAGLGDRSKDAVAEAAEAWNRSAPRDGRAKTFADNLVRVLESAIDLGNDPADALCKIRSHAIRSFDRKTALQLIREGRTDDVVAYLGSLSAGYVG